MTIENNLLQLADYSSPILRSKTKPVTFPLSAEVKQIIADMKYSIQPEQLKKANAPWESAVGMAANQWGIDLSIFLFCPDGDTVNGLSVIINPTYEVIAPRPGLNPHEDTAWEGCFSVPLASGNIKRSLRIRASYQNQRGEKFVMELSDWPARVWQHETDHLNGILYDDPTTGRCLEKREFKTVAEVEEFYATVR